jgi:V/A-type H+-transporting ATPase subunit E
MSELEEISGLEQALLARAQQLASEYQAGAQLVRQPILNEANQRLQAEEEREAASAKALAERRYQQRVQAAELLQQAAYDQLRWALAHEVMAGLPAQLQALAADDARYQPLLTAWLKTATQAIERDHLVAQVNARDLAWLQPRWAELSKQSAPDKQLELSTQALDCIGGVLVQSAAGDIRCDNTFEGRMARCSEALYGVIMQQFANTTRAQHG